MVCGRIKLTACAELSIVDDGRLTSKRYITDILESLWPHVAHFITEYLNYANIQVLKLPACSPNLYPIENLWDIMRRRVKSQHPPPNSLDELRHICVWEDIPQETIRSLIESMPRLQLHSE
ncbi:hypothetical protein ILUMI_21702, partial [Ignelater luminosus]